MKTVRRVIECASSVLEKEGDYVMAKETEKHTAALIVDLDENRISLIDQNAGIMLIFIAGDLLETLVDAYEYAPIEPEEIE